MTKHIHICLIGLFLLAGVVYTAPLFAKTNDSPVGVWKTIDDETGKARSFVKIWKHKGKLYGKITKLIHPDVPNPVCDKCRGNLKDKPIVGLRIMSGLYKDGDKWTGGRIIDPENGKSYKVTIKTQQNGKRLKVRGYVGVSLLGRTQYWYRVK